MPLVGLAAAAALFPSARTRRGALTVGGLAALALVLAAGIHCSLAPGQARVLRPVCVPWTALLYFGTPTAPAGVFLAARGTLGTGPAVPLILALCCVYVPGKFLVHRPKVTSRLDPGIVSAASEPVELVTRDGYRLNGRFFPAGAPGRAPAVIIGHGVMAEHAMYFASYGKLVHDLGYGALLFDFRGHGRSDGHVETYGVREVEDVRAAVDWLRARPDVHPGRIAIIGHSMGAAIAILAAAEIPEIGAVVTDAAYDDLRVAAAQRLRLGILPSWVGPALAEASFFLGSLESGIDRAAPQPIDRIAAIAPRPVLLIHSPDDRATSVECSRRLFAAAREPRRLLLVPGGHSRNHLKDMSPELNSGVADFLKAAFAGDPPFH